MHKADPPILDFALREMGVALYTSIIHTLSKYTNNVMFTRVQEKHKQCVLPLNFLTFFSWGGVVAEITKAQS